VLLFLFVYTAETHNEILLGLLLGYCIRGKKPLLIATLTAIAVVCFIVLPAIVLSLLALDVRRERLSRPSQTTVPVVVGLNYETAQIKLRDTNLKIRILATRRDLPLEPEIIIAQTPQGGDRRVARHPSPTNQFPPITSGETLRVLNNKFFERVAVSDSR
jgi:hypothetical protein